MTIYEDFARSEAMRRGIHPDVAVSVWNEEGGLTEPARVGIFPTGHSYWAPQLHYGGAEYPQFGTEAGMGNDFTRLTGWQPGDPEAWRDAMRFAYDWIKNNGWGRWFGARKIGIVGFIGVDRSAPWPGTPDLEWDFRKKMTTIYDPDVPVVPQPNKFGCSIWSLLWALRSLKRGTTAEWLQNAMLQQGVVTVENGLEDASGAELVAFIDREYKDYAGIEAFRKTNASIDDVRAIAGTVPVLIGGRAWNHWVGVRSVAPDKGLNLANPADGWMEINQYLRDSWDRLGSWTMVWLQTVPGVIVDPEPVPHPDTDMATSMRIALSEVTRGGVRQAIEDLHGKPLKEADPEITNITNRLDDIGNQFLV